MVMGGFVLHDDDCRIFPIIFDAKFNYRNPKDGIYSEYDIMEPCHFEFKTFYKTEVVETEQRLRTKTHLVESQPVANAMTPEDEPGSNLNHPTPLEQQNKHASTVSLDHLSRKRCISENEIKDRSKGDALAKTIVLIQLIWFLTQIIVRRVLQLPITPLEITTVAYIAVSGILYGIWWKKPKDVRHPIGITLTDGKHQSKYQIAKPTSVTAEWGDIIAFIFNGLDGYDVTSSQALPAFFSGEKLGVDKTDAASVSAEMALGCLFGAIHCAAWSLHFQTHTELYIWRIASVVVTAIPLLLIQTIPLTWAAEKYDFIASGAVAAFLLYLGGSVGAIAYIISRLLLLSLAFSSLRHLPTDALRVVPWTTFIPHIG
jgi:hypothetical protein